MTTIQDLKTAYIARHWQSIDDDARVHVHGVVAWIESELAALAAPDALAVVETKVYTDGSTVTGTPPLPDQSPAQQDAAADKLKPEPEPEPEPMPLSSPELAQAPAPAPEAGHAEVAAPGAERAQG